MFNLKKALLWAIPAVCLSLSTFAGENKHSLVPYTYHSTNLELKPSPFSKGYKLAAATFLPEFKDSEFGWIVTRPDGPNVDFCKDYPLTSCPDNAECSDCPTNKSYHKLLRCKNGFQNQGNSCIASTCQASGYEASVPTNQICTKITQGGLTCYKDCRSISCAGYTLDCDNFNVSNSNSKETCPDCSSSGSNCSPKLCKVSSCQNGYKIADNGTTCVALDDTCPNGYYKECETGTEGDPEYTEKGTACYMCKAKPQAASLPILYSDLTTSTEVIAGKTPIGVVFDESNQRAVALNESAKKWTEEQFDVNVLPNYAIDNAPLEDIDGKQNSLYLALTCGLDKKSCPAIEYAFTYSTIGTSAQDWYIPAYGQLSTLYSLKDRINATIAKTSGTPLNSTVWSSTEIDETSAWNKNFVTGGNEDNSNKTNSNYVVRPIINYGQVELNLPLLYTDMTVSKEIIDGKAVIGIVIDETQKIAVFLSESTTLWSENKEDISNLKNLTEEEALKDKDGKNNTIIVESHSYNTGIEFPAVNGVFNMSVPNKSNWYLPSAGELAMLDTKVEQFNRTIDLLGKGNKLDRKASPYWSSTEFGSDKVWTYVISSENAGQKSPGYLKLSEKQNAHKVRPFIKYGDLDEVKLEMPILYSDMTISMEVIAGKTPIGVVFDEGGQRALALQTAKMVWAFDNVDIPELGNTGSTFFAGLDYTGKQNTKKIIDYSIQKGNIFPAAETAYKYSTKGTALPDWYLPSYGETRYIFDKVLAINTTLAKIKGAPISTTDYMWTSNEVNASTAWARKSLTEYAKLSKTSEAYLRPVIQYNNINKPCYVGNCSACESSSSNKCQTCVSGYGVDNNGLCRNCNIYNTTKSGVNKYGVTVQPGVTCRNMCLSDPSWDGTMIMENSFNCQNYKL